MPAARERARPAMLALAVTVFPLNTHLAFYSTFWGGLTLLLAALYAGSLLARDDAAQSVHQLARLDNGGPRMNPAHGAEYPFAGRTVARSA